MTDPTPFAVAADVAARWIGADAPEPEQVDVYLEDVTAMVVREFPDIYERIDALGTDSKPAPGAVSSADVKRIVCEVVIRKFRNPEGARTIATGPFSATFGGDLLGQLVLTDEERRTLGGLPTGGSTQGAFSINMESARNPGWIGGANVTSEVQVGSINDPLWTGLVADD